MKKLPKFTCPADDKITDVGLTVGCVKQLPTSMNELQTKLKSIGLEIGVDLATQAVDNNLDNVSSDKKKDKKYFELGFQVSGDEALLIRWSYGWFYNTIGVLAGGGGGGSGSSCSGVNCVLVIDYSDQDMKGGFEYLAGGIARWVKESPITMGFGLFGGLGVRQTIIVDDFYKRNPPDHHISADEFYDVVHELGAEFILGYFSFFISERNLGPSGGIGLIF